MLGFVVVASLLIYFYRLLKPADDKVEYLETIRTEATAKRNIKSHMQANTTSEK